MTLTTRTKILILDLEMTCWADGPEGPVDDHGHHLSPHEAVADIIQIGVAELDLKPAIPVVTRSAGILVRPRRACISGFCTELTGITPEAVKQNGRHLHEALATLRKTFGSSGKAWAAWGDDKTFLDGECRRLGIEQPFQGPFFDWGLQWSMLGGQRSATGLRNALKQLGLAFEGRPHDAEHDAINTARLIGAVASRFRAPVPELSPDADPAGLRM